MQDIRCLSKGFNERLQSTHIMESDLLYSYPIELSVTLG